MGDEPDRDADPGPPRGALVALAVVLVLVLGCLWLVHALHGAAAVQDCVMAGRTNCAPLR